MAATLNTGGSGTNHVDRLLLQAEGEGGADDAANMDPNAVDGMYLLNALINEEAELRRQANHLEDRARDVEADHDDATRPLAGQMRQQEGEMRDLAAKVERAISEVQGELANDPKKKISRHKVDRLHSSAAMLFVATEQEFSSAESAHVGTEEHKAIIHHQVKDHAHQQLNRKKAATKQYMAKTTTKPKKAKEEHPPPEHKESVVEKVGHKLHEVREQVTHSSAWTSMKHTASEVGETVHHGVEVVKHWAPVAATVQVASRVMHGVTHPVETAHKVMAKAGHAMYRFKAMVCGWFGHAEEEAPELVPVPGAPVVVKKEAVAQNRALEVVKMIGLAGITGGLTVLPGDLTPPPTPMAPAAIHGIATLG